MEQRFHVRLGEMVEDAHIPPGSFADLPDVLLGFLAPFVAPLQREEQRVNARLYVQGLLSGLDRKNAEAISYLHGHERQALQKFVGQSPWDHAPLMEELARQVGRDLGEDDAVLVFDPSAFPKKGTESVGVKRQWCGRLGKVDNCQVGVFLAYVSRKEHALADFRLYLPKEWSASAAPRPACPQPSRSAPGTSWPWTCSTRGVRGCRTPGSPATTRWGAARGSARSCAARGESYLLDVPSNTLVRDLAEAAPPYSGRGRRPEAPFRRVDRLAAALPESAWETVQVRDGEKGPVSVRMARRLAQAREEGSPSADWEMLVVFQEEQGDGSVKHDYLLGHGALGVPSEELARVFKARHRIEECLERAKGEAGLADYQVRTWEGWHHHMTLSLLAAWFLTGQTRRGKKSGRRR